MRQHLLRTIVACAAGVALSTQAQSSTGGSSTDPSSGRSGSPSTYPGSSSATPGSTSSGSAASPSGWAGRMSATGRMAHEPVRGSQLTGAQVSSSSGSEIGTISDTIINPASGRLEFAVISVSGGAAGSSSSTAGNTSASSTGISSSTSVAGGKQVVVPWMLLRASSGGAGSSAASSSTSASSSQQQPSFVFAGDQSKLQSAPNFDASTDLSQPSWRQSIFSYFGLTGGIPGTGSAETPGGSSSSSSSSPGSTTPPQSSSSNP